MKELAYKLIINAPKEIVFSVLTDPEKVKIWAKGVVELEPVSGVPLTPGYRYITHIREGGRVNQYDGQIIECVPMERYVIQTSGKPFTMILDYTLVEVPDGTIVESMIEVKYHSGFFKFIGWLFSALTKSMARKQLDELKKLAEDEPLI